MITPIGTIKAGSLISMVRLRLKSFTDEVFPKNRILDVMNNCLSELVEISGALKDPEYRDNAIIPQTGGFVVSDNYAGIGTGYVDNTRKLTIPVTKVGVEWQTVTGFDQSWEGATIHIVYDNGQEMVTLDCIVDSIDTARTVVITEATEPGVDILETAFYSISGFTTATKTNDIDLAQLNFYKVIDKITAIEDTVNGLCIEIPQKDFISIKNEGSLGSYTDDIIWYREGSMIHFAKGYNIANYGIRKMYYTRLPQRCTTYDDYIDLKDNLSNMLIDMVLIIVLQALKTEIPQELMSSYSKLQAMRQSNAEKITKLSTSTAKTQ
jgi:hypothetical protein